MLISIKYERHERRNVEVLSLPHVWFNLSGITCSFYFDTFVILITMFTLVFKCYFILLQSGKSILTLNTNLYGQVAKHKIYKIAIKMWIQTLYVTTFVNKNFLSFRKTNPIKLNYIGPFSTASLKVKCSIIKYMNIYENTFK